MRLLILSKYATPILYPRHFRLGKELVDRGLKVQLVCSTANLVGKYDVPSFRGWYKKEVVDGVNVLWLKGPEISNKGFSRILSWLIFELQCLPLIFRRYDIVYTSSLSLLSVYNGLLHKYLFARKWILEIRDVWPSTPIIAGGFSERNFGIRFLSFTEKLGYRYSDILIGTMPNLKKRVNEELGISRKVEFLPQGVDISLFTAESEEIDEGFIRQYLPQDRFIVGYVGTLNANNPLDELCSLIERQSKITAEKYWFLILGRGELKNELQRRLKPYDNVVFPEPVEKKYIASILRYVDVGYDSIADGLANYGLSRNKWIDYFFNGCPVVCVHEGYQSMINEADFGTYVKYGDIDGLQQAFENVRILSTDQKKSLNERGKNYIMKEHCYNALADKLINWL